MNINYGIIAIKNNDYSNILHFCGYEEKPTKFDFDDLKRELTEDEEFELTTEMDNIQLVEANPAIVAYYKNIVGKIED